MKMGDKVIVYGYIDGYSYETTGQTNYIIALETGERVEIPLGVAINADEIVFKDNIKLKDVIKRIKEFDDETKLKWTYDILQELGSDFGSKIFHEAYQQGKLEGAWVGNQLKDADKIRRELNKPVVPQFVAEWIEYFKKYSGSLYGSIAPYSYYGHAITDDFVGDVKKILEWIRNNSETYARAWLDGYEVEKEKRYRVEMKGISSLFRHLKYNLLTEKWYMGNDTENEDVKKTHTRKEIEDAGFGEVFNSPLFEIEEVE